MKKLTLLTLTLFLNFSSFSQIDTTGSKVVVLREDIARKVAVDLVKGDAAIVELESTRNLVKILEQKVELKDKIIEAQNLRVDNLNASRSVLQQQIEVNNLYIKTLQNEIKSSKRREKTFKVLLGVAIVTSLAISIGM